MQNAPRSFGLHGLFTSLFALTLVGAVACSSTNGGDGSLIASNGDGTCKAGGPCACEGSAPCTLRCVGAGCDFKCQGTGRCDFSCPQGGCTVESQGLAPATLDCGGKTDCSMTCQGDGTCDLKACVDKCTQTCQGSGACTMSGCNGTCNQTCVGGGKCEGGTGSKLSSDGGISGVDAAGSIPPTPGFDAGSGNGNGGGGGEACADLADVCGSCPTPQLIQSCSATASAGNDAACASALTNYETQCQ